MSSPVWKKNLFPSSFNTRSSIDYELGFDYGNVDLTKYSYHLTNITQKEFTVRLGFVWCFELEVVSGDDTMKRLVLALNRENIRIENASVMARRAYGNNEAFYSLPLLFLIEEEFYDDPPLSPEELFVIPFVGYNLGLDEVLGAFDRLEARTPSSDTTPLPTRPIPKIEVEEKKKPAEKKKEPSPKRRVVKRRGSDTTAKEPKATTRRIIKKR